MMHRLALKTVGVVCVALISVTLLVHGAFAQSPSGEIKIQINQALGTQSDKYVAGKDTVIRVLLANAVTPKAGTDQVVVKRGSDTIVTLDPVAADSTKVVDFVCPNRAACGDWKAGDYTFAATVGGATATATAKFQDRRPLKILAVAVKANYGPGDVRVPDERWKKQGEFMKQVYPIAPEDYKWVLGQNLDASDDKFNLKTDDGMKELWIALANLQPQECAANPKAPVCYDLIVGFVKDRQGKDSNVQGYTYGAPANIITESDEDAPATVAHEVAHVFKAGDEYDQMGGAFNCAVNNPPPTFVGRDWNNRENTTFRCEKSVALPFPVGTASLVKAETDYPYEVGGRGALPDMASFMGSGIPQDKNWTTAELWSWLFDQMAPNATVAALHKAAPSDSIKYVAAFGMVTKEGKVTIEPWYSFTDTVAVKDPGGKYAIQAVDAMSNTLASMSFEPQFIVNSNPPKIVTDAPFELAVPFPDKTAAFRVVKGTDVLKVVPVYPNSPQVKILTPKANEKLDGKYTITWEAKHKDGATMYYSVEYSDNGEDWVALATEITDTKWEDDFTTIPGSDKTVGRIKVTATDGINATEAVSDLFNVPLKAPEVFIEDPVDNATFKVGEEVALSGAAYDLQDDWLYQDDQLAWSSDVQGDLGGGETLNIATLKPGTHVITLKATNSFKLASTAKVTIMIK